MIYTKTGDGGTTSLVGGTRVKKCDVRVEAYGTVDELNAHVGLLAEMIRATHAGYFELLKQVQHNLFIVQTLLATEADCKYELPKLPEDAVTGLEGEIDRLQEIVPKLKYFVIPGGTLAGAQCHVARTVCRRAERCVVTLSHQNSVDDILLRYLNRLSDYLFVLARHAVVSVGAQEDLYIS